MAMRLLLALERLVTVVMKLAALVELTATTAALLQVQPKVTIRHHLVEVVVLVVTVVMALIVQQAVLVGLELHLALVEVQWAVAVVAAAELLQVVTVDQLVVAAELEGHRML